MATGEGMCLDGVQSLAFKTALNGPHRGCRTRGAISGFFLSYICDIQVAWSGGQFITSYLSHS